MSKLWGFSKIVESVNFLNTQSGLAHCNVCMSSVFVNDCGEWKLGGFDYSVPLNSPPTIKDLSSLHMYEPPEMATNDYSTKDSQTSWANDMWGLGCLLWEMFNGYLHTKHNLMNTDKIPKSVRGMYMKMMSKSPKSRPKPEQILTRGKNENGFLDNKLCKMLIELDTLQVAGEIEVRKFLKILDENLSEFSPVFQRKKILPELLKAYRFGNAGRAEENLISPAIKLVTQLSDSEFEKEKIVEFLMGMLVSSDRTVRSLMLKRLDLYIGRIPDKVINKDTTFDSIVRGLTDTVPYMRELTLKAMVTFAPKLNDKNMHVILLKNIARIQKNDEEEGLRTNATICVAKVANWINPQMRQKILVSAFARAAEDKSPSVQLAAIQSFQASSKFFSVQTIAQNILPVLSPMTIRPEKKVRDLAFTVIGEFLTSLKRVSEDPSVIEEIEAMVKESGGGNSSSEVQSIVGWLGLSSISSTFSRSFVSSNQAESINKPAATAQPAATETLTSIPSNSLTVTSQSKKQRDDNVAMADERPPASYSLSSVTTDKSGDGWDWDDETFEDTRTEEPDEEDDTVSAEEKESWDSSDWFNDWGDSSASTKRLSTTKSKQSATDDLEDKRAERREKLAQRNADRAAKKGKGPMKLGTKKLY